MIGQFKEMGGKCYITANVKGTIVNLPKIKWYHQLYLHLLNYFQGHVHINDVERLCKR